MSRNNNILLFNIFMVLKLRGFGGQRHSHGDSFICYYDRDVWQKIVDMNKSTSDIDVFYEEPATRCIYYVKWKNDFEEKILIWEPEQGVVGEAISGGFCEEKVDIETLDIIESWNKKEN